MAFRSDLDSMILAVLRQGPAHGYEIAIRIRMTSGEILSAGEGQIYPALHKLEADGCVQSEWQIQEGRPSRRTYSITDKGVKSLQDEVSKWKSFRSAVDSVFGLGESKCQS